MAVTQMAKDAGRAAYHDAMALIACRDAEHIKCIKHAKGSEHAGEAGHFTARNSAAEHATALSTEHTRGAEPSSKLRPTIY